MSSSNVMPQRIEDLDLQEISTRKIEVEDKLAMEDEKLGRLKDYIERSKRNSEAIMGILGSFEERLSKLEVSVRPVHESSLQLTRIHENIEKAALSLETIIAYYEVFDEVSGPIKAGVGKNPTDFIEQLEIVDKAIAFFKQKNIGGTTRDSLVELFSFGVTSLENAFKQRLEAISASRDFAKIPFSHAERDSLKKDSLIVLLEDDGLMEEEEGEKEGLLASIEIEEGDTSAGGKRAVTAFGADFNAKLARVYHKTMPREEILNLKTISTWLEKKKCGKRYKHLYAEVREAILAISLESIPVKVSNLNVSAATRERRMSIADDGNGGSGGGAGGRRTSVAAGADIKGLSGGAGLYVKGSHPYLVMIEVFIELLLAERALIDQFIPSHNVEKTFNRLTRTPSQLFFLTGYSIVDPISSHVKNHEFHSVFEVFDVFGHLKLKERIFLKLYNDNRSAEIFKLMETYEVACGEVLDAFMGEIKSDPSDKGSVPQDGTVHELTSTTLNFFGKLYEYGETIEAVIGNTSQYDDNDAMGTYLVEVMTSLESNLMDKATMYEDSTLGDVFLLNNYHYIMKTIRKSAYSVIFRDFFASRFDKLFSEKRRDYQGGWMKCFVYLMDAGRGEFSGEPGDEEKGKVSSQEKSKMKEKFRGFTQAFEDVYNLQRHYCIPDDELREQFRNDNVNLVVPLYRKFLDKFSHPRFKKLVEKYQKYTPEELEGMVGQFFENSV
eukprot:Nk52_evm20s1360 gene=Nk52_evmTU20s1360